MAQATFPYACLQASGSTFPGNCTFTGAHTLEVAVQLQHWAGLPCLAAL